MTQEELDQHRFASRKIVLVAEELSNKLSVNDSMILERRISASTTTTLSSEFITVLSQILAVLKAQGVEDPQTKIDNLSAFVTSVVKHLEESVKSTNDDVIRLEATQEGMRRALEAVRESGLLQERELEKIQIMSERDDVTNDRGIGEHPDPISLKRNAASVKKSREKSNI